MHVLGNKDRTLICLEMFFVVLKGEKQGGTRECWVSQGCSARQQVQLQVIRCISTLILHDKLALLAETIGNHTQALPGKRKKKKAKHFFSFGTGRMMSHACPSAMNTARFYSLLLFFYMIMFNSWYWNGLWYRST